MTETTKPMNRPRLMMAPPRRAYAEVANRILEQLRDSGVGAGWRLPPERQLADDLGVSRATIREALVALEIVGAVETKVGAGTFVVAPVEFDPEAWAAEASPYETLEARLVIEPKLSELAARRWDRRTLAAVRRPVDELATWLESGSLEHPTALDREFHAAVATAAANTVLAELVTPLRDLMSGAVWLALKNRTWTIDHLVRLHEEHHRIYRAIRDRDGDAASFEMEAHLRRIQDDLFAHA